MAEQLTFYDLPEGLWNMLPFRYCGPPVTINFQAANTNREILHRCPSVPDGFLQIDSPEGARLARAPAMAWGSSTAWLQSDKDKSTATVIFVLLREAPTNVQPTT